TAEVNHDIGTFEAAHDTADDVAHAVLELLKDQLLFGLSKLLHHRLPGVLGGDPAKVSRGDLDLDFVADLRVGFDASRLGKGDLIVLGNHAVTHQKASERLDSPRFGIDAAPEITRWTDGTPGRRDKSLLDGFHQDVATDAFLALPVFQ